MADFSDPDGHVVAVLTGDIVRSSTLNLSRRFDLYEELRQLSARVRHHFHDEIPYDMAKYRGDGWQLLVSDAAKAFEISLFLRTALRFQFGIEKLDTRIVIAIGKVDFVPPDNLSAGFGSAFTDSGKLLDELKDHRMGFTLSEHSSQPVSQVLAQMIRVYDHLISSWTPSQCQAVFYALQGLTQADIGRNWLPQPISQVAVAKHLKSADWELVKQGLAVFHKTISEIHAETKG